MRVGNLSCIVPCWSRLPPFDIFQSKMKGKAFTLKPSEQLYIYYNPPSTWLIGFTNAR